MITPIKVTLFLDNNFDHLCPVCKAKIERANARLAFTLTPTEVNFKRFGDKLLECGNAVVVDSLNCKWKYEGSRPFKDRMEMAEKLGGKK